MRIVFMGTPDFSVPSLASLLESGNEIAAVYTQPDRPEGRGRYLAASPVKKMALSQSIKVFQPESLRSDTVLEELRDLSPEAIVVLAYGKMLPEEILSLPPHGCINVHPSLLPRHRGPSPIPWAILEGDGVTGVTTMLMDAGMDTGPLLEQKEIPILDTDTALTLQDRLARVAAGLLPRTLKKWSNGEIQPKPQDCNLATYSKQISKEDGRMDWTLPAVVLWRRVRALQPWPGCYTHWSGRTLKIIGAAPFSQIACGNPGLVVSLSEDDCQVGVGTGEGVLGLLRVQLEGKKEIGAADFTRGQRGFLGSVLPC